MRIAPLHVSVLVWAAPFALALGCSDDGPEPMDSGVTTDATSDAPLDADTGPGVTTDLVSGLVVTTTGPVQGEVADTVRIFRGIPYAAPPVGDLRWTPPAPVAPWEGTHDATRFGASCPQPSSEFLPGFDPGVLSEDCLTANVWTPAEAPGDGLPVMLWIHGGGYTLGSGSSDVFESTRLATRGDVVVVTFNYRLGPLANMSHPALSTEGGGSSGNYGLRDQIAMLEWVRDNIAEFGGDPGNVTVFGESAGGGGVCFLTASPYAAGLFHRAIVQSANCFGPLRELRDDVGRLTSAEELGETVAEGLGCPPSAPLDCMRAASFEEIAAAGNLASGAFAMGEKFWPIVDGDVLPDQIEAIVSAGAHNAVPTIIGTTAREAALFRSSFADISSQAAYETRIRALFGLASSRVLAAYPVSSDDEALNQYEQLITDLVFRCPARRIARALDARSDAWLFDFAMVHPSGERVGYGSYHGTDVFYTFGNLVVAGATAADIDEDHEAVTDAVQDYWTSFARAGRPEGPVPWPAHDATTDAHLTLDVDVVAGTGLLRDECDLFDTF